VTLGAVVNECCFEARLDSGDTALVYIGFLLLVRWGLNVQVEQVLAIDHGHTQLFGLRGID